MNETNEEKDKNLDSQNTINEQQTNQEQTNTSFPDTNKPYATRNFVKEIKRISWPTKKKHYRYFFITLIFLVCLVAFFALVTFGAKEILDWIGVK